MSKVKEVIVAAGNQNDSKLIGQLENEINLMRNLKHPHIVCYLGHDYMGATTIYCIITCINIIVTSNIRQYTN